MFVALVTCLVSAAASKTTVSGTVVDPSGEPLIGVAVAVVGNNTMGTTTDIDGNFTLADLPETQSSASPMWDMSARKSKSTTAVISM